MKVCQWTRHTESHLLSVISFLQVKRALPIPMLCCADQMRTLAVSFCMQYKKCDIYPIIEVTQPTLSVTVMFDKQHAGLPWLIVNFLLQLHFIVASQFSTKTKIFLFTIFTSSSHNFSLFFDSKWARRKAPAPPLS